MLLEEIRALQAEASESAARSLTIREVGVLFLIACGLSNDEISELLVLSVKTVKNHISRVFAKLGVDNRTEAAVYGCQHLFDIKDVPSKRFCTRQQIKEKALNYVISRFPWWRV